MPAFAEDIGIDPNHAQTMKARKSIPPKYWEKVISAAQVRGIDGVNAAELMRLAATKKKGAAKVKKRVTIAGRVTHSRKNGQALNARME